MKKRDGFSLVEVLISLVILAVGLLGLAALHVSAIRTNSSNRELSYATLLMQKKLEELKALPFNSTSLNSNVVHSEGVIDEKGTFYLVRWIVDDNIPDEGFKTIIVQVNWNGTAVGGTSRVSRSINATAVLKED